MEGGTLFNPGFLGGSFLWWVGQIADDSTWRDNHLTGKFEGKDTIPGWGRRYKVRIIGLHDKEEETIPSDQLPWAQVMYPITAGGGQTNAKQTPNLRQGNFVFGFFLDGQNQQTPVIMGVLGNNDQTVLKGVIGRTDTNFGPTSGYAEGSVPKEPATREIVPDEDLVTDKPKSAEQTQECAAPPPGTRVNEFGLRTDLALTNSQYQDQQSAIAEADRLGLVNDDRTKFIQKSVADGIKNRCRQANSPNSPSQGQASKESVGNEHRVSVADVKLDEKYTEKIVLMKPGEGVNSALKGIQTALDNLVNKMNKYLNAISSYIDAASNTISDLQSVLDSAADEISKYMKIIMDKIMEYILKTMNKALNQAVAMLPSNLRFQFADMKEQITELVLCLYGKMVDSLAGTIKTILNDVLDPAREEQRVRDNLNNTGGSGTGTGSDDDNVTTPYVPMCSAESVVGQIIASNRKEMDNANNALLDNTNAFLENMQDQLAGVSDTIGNINSTISGITGSMTSALDFQNVSLNIFGCELKPNPAVSDYYTFGGSGASQPDGQKPSSRSVDSTVIKSSNKKIATTGDKPYAVPAKNQPDVVNK